MEARTIELSAPLEHGGQVLTQLTVHPPRVGDLLAAETAERSAARDETGPTPATVADLALLAACTRVDVATVQAIGLRDFQAGVAILRDFLAGAVAGPEDMADSAAPSSPSPAPAAPTLAGS